MTNNFKINKKETSLILVHQKKKSEWIFNYFILRGQKKKTRKVIIDIEQDPIILKSAFKKKKDLILVLNNQHDSLTQKKVYFIKTKLCLTKKDTLISTLVFFFLLVGMLCLYMVYKHDSIY